MILISRQQAFDGFTQMQRIAIQQHILGRTSSAADSSAIGGTQSACVRTSMTEGQDKNVQHMRINNNRAEQHLLTIDAPRAVDNSTSIQECTHHADVNLKNTTIINNSSLKDSEKHATVIKKLKATYRCGEVHINLQQKYSLRALIHEALGSYQQPKFKPNYRF